LDLGFRFFVRISDFGFWISPVLHPVSGSTHGLPDAAAFLALLEGIARHPLAEARGLFDAGREIVVARAPGRLDVMGGIADYSGSLVLQLPLREAAFAALQRDPARVLRLVSLGAEENRRAASFEMPLDAFERDGRPLPYEAAREMFRRDPARRWAAYAAGAFLVLMRERGAVFREGARILIDSSVPEGRGVSSSAALEVAVMQAVCAAFDITVELREMALLCQKVENLVVGAPCGVMDQMTAVCGEENRLLTLWCQPAQLQGTFEIPDGAAIWGIDSGIRHAVSGSDYTSVRVGAFMGYRIIADLAGLSVEPGDPMRIDDPIWKGYLANIPSAEFTHRFRSALPERVNGGEFLDRYGGTTDAVTRVERGREYTVRVATAHPVYEQDRVRTFARRLLGFTTPRRLELLGKPMYQSHASYGACGLGSDGTDRLVELVREAGPSRGLFGAKITGGGSGGTVAVLGRKKSGAAVQEIADRYARETGRKPHLFSGSSPGAAATGVLRLRM
jgi:L-arabinokinase